MDLLPTPTIDELRELRNSMGWSASAAAAAFWLGEGRRWRELEAGERQMDRARWTLGLLALGLHPTMRLAGWGLEAKRRYSPTECATLPAT